MFAFSYCKENDKFPRQNLERACSEEIQVMPAFHCFELEVYIMLEPMISATIESTMEIKHLIFHETECSKVSIQL